MAYFNTGSSRLLTEEKMLEWVATFPSSKNRVFLTEEATEIQKEEAEAQEFVEEGEDDGWGVPDQTPMTKEELAELQQEMGTPGKGNVKGKGAKSKEAGESAAKKAEDKIDDELCW